MHDLASTALRIRSGRLEVLDQRLLPQQEVWIPADSPADMVTAIQTLAVRGAPLIGVAAALCLGRLAEGGVDLPAFRAEAARLRAARPTAVNLMILIDRLLAAVERSDSLSGIPDLAVQAFDEDVALCQAIARHGATIIPAGAAALTHCNAGALATVGVGTAVGVLIEAHRQGRLKHVWVDETRPLLQGARLTAWELARCGVPHTLICDHMAASLMRAGRIQVAVVGADRIAANGDFANKIGTYGVAVLAHHHRIPFYVAAPWTTVDPQCPDGEAIPIEERAANEVRGFSGSAGDVAWAAQTTPVFNPAFDVTPADLVTGWIQDRGVLDRKAVVAGSLTSPCAHQ